MSDQILSVHNLRTYYKTRFNERIFAVDDVSFQLAEGKILGIAGESGCGKSTLALSLMGYYSPPLTYASGSIAIGGVEVTGMNYNELRKTILGKRIAYIPQAAMNALNPTQKIKRFIRDIFAEHRPQMKKKEVWEAARERFAVLNLPERVLNAYPNELSGGMKQRTVIAISTILNPTVLIADEPSSALDVSSQKVVIKLLRRLLDEGFVKSIIFITHELVLLSHVADNILVMYAGEVAEFGATKKVVFDALNPYARALMGSIIVPEEGMRERKITALMGSPPNLKHVPPGCRFAERCTFVEEKCCTNKIQERTIGARRYRCCLDPESLQRLYAKNEEEQESHSCPSPAPITTKLFATGNG